MRTPFETGEEMSDSERPNLKKRKVSGDEESSANGRKKKRGGRSKNSNGETRAERDKRKAIAFF